MNLKPKRCYYYVRDVCASRCAYCNIWENRDDGSLTPLEEVKRHIDELAEIGVGLIDFTGGEPLLRKELPEILAYAKARGFSTIQTTDGTLYRRRAEELVGRIDFLHFSLDTVDREVYRKRRGVDRLPEVLAAIDRAHELGQPFDFLTTVDNTSLEAVPGVIGLAEQYGTRVSLNPIFSYFKDEAGLSASAFDRLEEWSRRPSVYLNTDQLALIRSGGNRVAEPTCGAMTQNIVISQDGYLLLPCYHQTEERVKIGPDGIRAAMARTEQIAHLEGRYDFCEGCTINCYMKTARLRTEELATGFADPA